MTELKSKRKLPKQWAHWSKLKRLRCIYPSWRKHNLRFLYLKSKTYFYVIRLHNNDLNISGATSQLCMWSNSIALTTPIPTTFDAFKQLIEAIDLLIIKQQNSEGQIMAKDILLTGKIGCLDNVVLVT